MNSKPSLRTLKVKNAKPELPPNVGMFELDDQAIFIWDGDITEEMMFQLLECTGRWNIKRPDQQKAMSEIALGLVLSALGYKIKRKKKEVPKDGNQSRS